MPATETNEFSFILKPSKISGVGVFATHDIAKDTLLDHLFNEPARWISKVDVPKQFHDYCIDVGNGTLVAPPDFAHMSIGWYINHSKEPNAASLGPEYSVWTAIKDIYKGDEITANYVTFNEPTKPEYV